MNWVPANIYDKISKNIPSSVEPFEVVEEPAATATYPTSKTPKTMRIIPVQWWRNYFFFKNHIEKNAVITQINPRIIW